VDALFLFFPKDVLLKVIKRMSACMGWPIKMSLCLTLLVLTVSALAQVEQLNIARVQQMPNIPSPYLMRNWKEVATHYDQLIFSTGTTGQHLPLINTKPTGVNYPELSPILLQTYVGTNSANQAEAINIIPAIVSGALMNIDKSNQGGINWVSKTKEFFNKSNGENVFLNGYLTNSGGDWWYDVMPNIFFYQLYTRYPTETGFHEQFISVADRWLEAVNAMGGKTTPWTLPQMNYRAWNLMTMTGNTDGVKEPEAAGGIGWLLYHAYLTTGKTKYLDGAQLCIEYLSNLTSNPSYELQLPYGTFIAAKMNAELGTTYDISKMLNWNFDRSPSRGWGAIVGTWNGSAVDGLIGEANDSGNDYAFALNGFQQAAALVPMIKYDKRFARAIAKWVLNLANASRFFYSQYLPQTSQDDYTWSSTYDPQSIIAYEALKEKNTFNNNIPLYGTGDAKRNSWAQTNLSLYSSSSVGYLAAIVEPSDVEGILLLDVNKTDFFTDDIYPSYVIYNPHPTNKPVTLQLPSGSHDIYDAISESILVANATGTAQINIKSDEAVILVYIPSGSDLAPQNGKLYSGDKVIDHRYGYNFSASLRIKSLAVTDTLVEFNQQVPVYVATENANADAIYNWYSNGDIISSSSTPSFIWTVPTIPGTSVLLLEVASGGQSVSDSILFNVVDDLPAAPVVNAIATDKRWYIIGSPAVITCQATDQQDTPDQLTYEWSVSSGNIVTQTGATLTWQAPAVAGVYEITCKVTDRNAMSTTEKKLVLVKPMSLTETPAFIYYPLDGDSKDYSGNHRDATSAGVDPVPDVRGETDKAYLFNSGSDIIYLPNNSDLNFQNAITLSFWVNLDALAEESFIISHGSWEERWKVSVTPDRYLRWTVKTSTGTKDLDSSFPLEFGHFYHFSVSYSGYSLELYADGELDTFSAHSGLMSTTTKSLTLGRKDENVTRYSFFGTLDEVRIYNAALSPDEVGALDTTWNTVVTGLPEVDADIHLYPNPSHGYFYISSTNIEHIKHVSIFDVNGRAVDHAIQRSGDDLLVTIQNQFAGLLVLKIQTGDSVFHKKILLNK
jgi:hypothetical protein